MAVPTTDSLFDGIVSDILYKLSGKCIIKNEVEIFLKSIKLHNETEDCRESSEDWLQWAKDCRNLKIVSFPVPPGILPKEYSSGELLDVKVSCRGPDDFVYDSNQLIRQRVARGNCFLRMDGGPYSGSRLVLYGLKKFTGGLGDDDDRDKGDNFTWQRYFTKPLDTAVQVVATRKANGEAAHLSCIELGGNILICAGSKNVHLLFRTYEDIRCYQGDRFRIASEICEVIMNILKKMDNADEERLLKFLAMTGYTAIFEILSPDHQHVEDLSHLPGNILQFITWTDPHTDPQHDDQLCTIPPHIGIEIARALGLITVEYSMIPICSVESHIAQIRYGYQFEGEVLYFLDETATVIGLLKKKTIWYIICRAIREKARAAAVALRKNASMFSPSVYIKRTEKRLEEIQTWLNVDAESMAAWKTLAVGFLKWTVSGLECGRINQDDIGDKFPVLWKQYIEESGKSDRIHPNYKEPQTTPVTI